MTNHWIEGVPVSPRRWTVADSPWQTLLASATPEALAICRAWDEHFGEPGWGSRSYVQAELHYAEQAVAALRALLREKEVSGG